MGVETRRSFHLQEPPGRSTRGRALGGSFQCGRRPRAALDPRQSRAGTAARRLPSNPRHRAAPSSSRGEDEVEGLALCGGDVGVPQVHHEDHAGTFLWGTWVGCKHGVRLRSRGSTQCSPRRTGVTGSPVPPAGSSPPGLLWAIRPQGFPSQGGGRDAELALLAAVPWSRAGSCCCAIAALPAPQLPAGLRFPIPQQG